jgi:hypothetical protein
MAVARRKIADDGQQYYPTPRWATRALLKQFGHLIKGSVWEPACGGGDISEELMKLPGVTVVSTDLYPKGYGKPDPVNFLTYDLTKSAPRHIITNPPYSQSTAFMLQALQLLAKNKEYMLALFLPLGALGGQARYSSIYKTHSPTHLLTFSERVTLYPAGADPEKSKGAGTLEHGWFVWTNIPNDIPPFTWVPPGSKDILSKGSNDV